MYSISGVSLFAIAIAIGGALGAMLRALVSKLFFSTAFPFATLLVNCLGSFLMGIVYIWLTEKCADQLLNSELLRSTIMVGFLGALTTFSTFSLEVFLMYSHGHIAKAALYIIASISLSLLALWSGIACMRIL